jgi:hypothetical protein
MAGPQTTRLSLRLAAVPGEETDAAELEALTIQLREELLDLAERVDQVPAGPAPEGTRGLELVVGAWELLVTVIPTAAALTTVVRFIQDWRDRDARRRRAVQLSLNGVEVPTAPSGEGQQTLADQVRQVVEALAAAPAPPRAPGRSALVVTNAVYDDPRLRRLRSPVHDAEALARTLGNPAIGGFDVDLLSDADERTVRRRVAAFFADRDRDDVLLLHFSCHGLKDPRGRLHLAARDSELSALGATAVAASFVSDQMAQSASRRIVLVLDCCYSGAFARGAVVRSDRGVNLADEFATGSGRIVLTASSATEYAFDGTELSEDQSSPSVFTSALVSGLESGEADLNGDGEISVDELYQYAHRQVLDRTPGQQPQKWAYGIQGDLVVARSTRPARLPPRIHEDLASERVSLRKDAVRELHNLLGSSKAGLREAARVELTRVRDEDDSIGVRTAAATALGTGMASPQTPVPAPEPPQPPAPVEPPARPAPALPPAPAPPPAEAAPAPAPTPPADAEAPAADALPASVASASPEPPVTSPEPSPEAPPPAATPAQPTAQEDGASGVARRALARSPWLLAAQLLTIIGAVLFLVTPFWQLGWWHVVLLLVVALANLQATSTHAAAFLIGGLSWAILLVYEVYDRWEILGWEGHSAPAFIGGIALLAGAGAAAVGFVRLPDVEFSRAPRRLIPVVVAGLLAGVTGALAGWSVGPHLIVIPVAIIAIVFALTAGLGLIRQPRLVGALVLWGWFTTGVIRGLGWLTSEFRWYNEEIFPFALVSLLLVLPVAAWLTRYADPKPPGSAADNENA